MMEGGRVAGSEDGLVEMWSTFAGVRALSRSEAPKARCVIIIERVG